MDYLTDWTDIEEDCLAIEESITEIELYGVTFNELNDDLVKAALRHFIGVINPWNKDAVPEILQGIGFSEIEIERYWEQLYSN
ncbi:hypothetical protein C7391_0868 [Methanimicrococcus blatticola]|uniref:Uncharacterized protein n=2 Tax=Methanimicrococcus blatticola TaxID=91560 RepID=A0A484F7J3_9EURY|nr:hypothetical protein C7391_0868 [Methanimicrococcus blatticola]